MSGFPGLSADKLRADVDPAIIGREIVVLEETTSTNDSVLERASESKPEGLVVFAERQTAGRGQRNNSWESVPGKGLWFSILLRPKIDIGDSPILLRWATRAARTTSPSASNAILLCAIFCLRGSASFHRK